MFGSIADSWKTRPQVPTFVRLLVPLAEEASPGLPQVRVCVWVD